MSLGGAESVLRWASLGRHANTRIDRRSWKEFGIQGVVQAMEQRRTYASALTSLSELVTESNSCVALSRESKDDTAFVTEVVNGMRGEVTAATQLVAKTYADNSTHYDEVAFGT